MAKTWVTTLCAAMLAACSSTTKDVRSGSAWDDAKPGIYPASAEAIRREVKLFFNERRFQLTEEGETLLKAYRAGRDLAEQNIEMHVRIEPGPTEGTTRVLAISGRSAGVEWFGSTMHDRLHDHLRSVYPPR
ncbi:MAG: hypothetical protein ACT4PV_00960 [Planctomycetaceae bacterium]